MPNTKRKVYILKDCDTGIITDVTTDYYKAIIMGREIGK